MTPRNRFTVAFDTTLMMGTHVQNTNLRWCNDGTHSGSRGNTSDIAYAAITEQYMTEAQREKVDYRLVMKRNRRWENLVASAEADIR